MSKYSSKNWGPILEAKPIEYGHQTRNAKQMARKVLNTILAFLAYRCPSNKLRIQLHRWRGCHIGDNCYIGQYCVLDNLAPEYIYIEDRASINAESMILTHFNPSAMFKKVFEAELRPTYIKEDAIIAVRSTIMPGVTIGRSAVINAGSIVEKDVPDYNLFSVINKVKYIDLSKLLHHN